jgi:hypothetical protein
MWSAASVLVCALSLLGRSERSMPPIVLIEVAPPEVSFGAEAFVRRSTGTIYLITSSPAFLQAVSEPRTCAESVRMKKLASILVHEEWHVLHGPDEKPAYEAQLMALFKLGVEPTMGLYREVQTSMRRIVALRQRNRPEIVVASGR